MTLLFEHGTASKPPWIRVFKGKSSRQALSEMLQTIAPAACSLHEEGHPPRVRGAEGWYASVSHRGPYSAVALAQTPIGVDVEDTTAPNSPVGGYPSWTAREATAKATHQARALTPGQIHLPNPSSSSNPSIITAQALGHTYTVHLHSAPTWCVAWAVVKS